MFFVMKKILDLFCEQTNFIDKNYTQFIKLNKKQLPRQLKQLKFIKKF